MQKYPFNLEFPSSLEYLTVNTSLLLTVDAVENNGKNIESILRSQGSKATQKVFEDEVLDDEEEFRGILDADFNAFLEDIWEPAYGEFPNKEKNRCKHEEFLLGLLREKAIHLRESCTPLPIPVGTPEKDMYFYVAELSFLDFVKYANAVNVGVWCDQVLILPTQDHDPVRESEHVAMQMSGAALECNQVVTETPESPTPLPAAASDGVELAKAGPVEDGLSTKEISDTFGDVNGWDASRWIKNLSASKWLHPARIALGGAGGASSVWNPLTLAQLMHSKKKGDKAKEKIMKAFNSRFARTPILEPWRDAFNEYLATHCTTE